MTECYCTFVSHYSRIICIKVVIKDSKANNQSIRIIVSSLVNQGLQSVAMVTHHANTFPKHSVRLTDHTQLAKNGMTVTDFSISMTKIIFPIERCRLDFIADETDGRGQFRWPRLENRQDRPGTRNTDRVQIRWKSRFSRCHDFVGSM